ncbi:hypothetical protein O181_110032 [Austropuccinia psidii MF-1]|uniref:Reverse transcriptase domain-containing protein n=1 Tax=Austropuccinia psidii MF-1 TaxID=1389203 RepID=A0A9Q3JYZ7_9BASI|nr:hypothetical protein [Austropuccinia psidii MF-1]
MSKKGEMNEINIEKEPDVEKNDVIEENSHDKSSISSESSKDIESFNATFDIMEMYSPLPQLSNSQLYLSKIQDAQLMKTKPRRGKGYTSGSSCITEVIIDKKPTKLLLDPGSFCSCVVYISTMDALKGFNQNVVTLRARRYLGIIVHCGVYEYLRMPFGIKNAPSHFQRKMNNLFPEELSEEWFIIDIEDIIVCSKTWEEHMCILSRILTKIQSVNIKISLKKCHFGLKELKELGHVVYGLSLGIEKNNVAAVFLKPMCPKKGN